MGKALSRSPSQKESLCPEQMAVPTLDKAGNSKLLFAPLCDWEGCGCTPRESQIPLEGPRVPGWGGLLLSDPGAVLE